jgi:hypothetical protein
MKRFIMAAIVILFISIAAPVYTAEGATVSSILQKFFNFESSGDTPATTDLKIQSTKTNPRLPPQEPPEPSDPPQPPVATTTPPVATSTPPIPTPVNGLIAQWKFDDGSGADATGLGNTGTLMNGPVSSVGQIAQALLFDGVDDRIDIASSNTSSSYLRNILRGGASTKSFTISAWINQKACGPKGVIVARTGFINVLITDCGSVTF